MRLYVGLGERQFNHRPIPPSIRYACVSPISGRSAETRQEVWVSVPPGVEVIQDSGAFSDSWDTRLTFAAALERQRLHAEKHGYLDQITHRASYDLLIDETWQEGQRNKKRWSYEDARQAVETTVAASHFAAANRDSRAGLIQSAQGVEPKQYLDCARRVIDNMDTLTDKLGLGGWCIVGIRRELMPVFHETLRLVIPYAAAAGVQSVHIWGVIYPAAIGMLQWWADEYELTVSTDSTSPTLKPVWGQWGYGDERRKIEPINPDRRGAARLVHVCQTRHYVARIADTRFYVANFEEAQKENYCVVCGAAISERATTCGPTCRQRKLRASRFADRRSVTEAAG